MPHTLAMEYRDDIGKTPEVSCVHGAPLFSAELHCLYMVLWCVYDMVRLFSLLSCLASIRFNGLLFSTAVLVLIMSFFFFFFVHLMINVFIF
jgi:hypothetical protein